jgi:hypothetical protein
MANTPIVPIADDPLFALPDPGNATVFLLPKEGEPLSKCQDFYAVNVEQRIYAVTDGVSTSFAPRAWASIVARSIVQNPFVWRGEDAFTSWLSEQGEVWHDWITNRWVTTIHALQAQRGENLLDYSRLIDETGAQTTLICAALLPEETPQQARVELLAIGDAEAFHVEREDGRWVVRQAFPFSAPEQFGAQPAMLATIDSPQWREFAWQRRATHTLTVQTGDRIVLTSDTLAEWLLHDRDARMQQLLALHDAADFERLIEQERLAGQMKDDDMTLLIIPML